MEVTPLPPPPSLDALPDEILRTIFLQLESEELGEALQLFTVNRKVRMHGMCMCM
jgi:hypothetical protein